MEIRRSMFIRMPTWLDFAMASRRFLEWPVIYIRAHAMIEAINISSGLVELVFLTQKNI
jgi:hypothetical protein